ncbi:MAG TPA: NOP5/NOP56 family protein [Candidatus Thermoplasmatota archaeon]|nr:NOP5/NOP56 family protein [Candidatus Thermoplasmatota archaeon]
MFLVTEWFGAFLLDGERVRTAREFPRDPAELAERLRALDAGEVLEEERALAAGQERFEVAEARLLTLPGAALAPKAPSVRGDAAERGFTQAMLRDAVLAMARAKAKEAMTGRDHHVVQAVQTIDDLAEAANLLAERLREWYGLHFPEAARLVERHEELATLISQHGTRDAILERSPHLQLAKPSMGADLGDAERDAVRGLAKSLSTLYAQRAELERYLEGAMPGIAPNVTAMVGPPIAARLLFHAGGLEELAKLPSGTIQTLGAEKALFRHLKDGNRPPKHGVLFQHPLIHRAPLRERGRLARTLAGKIAIAARADAFTHKDLSASLQASMAKRADAVRAAGPRRRPAMPKPQRPGHARPGQGAPRGPQGGKGWGGPPPGRDRRGGPPGRGPPPRRGRP